MMKIFLEAPITAYRRDTNIQDILVHSKYNKIFRQETKTEGTYKCGKKCAVCEYLNVGIEHITLDNRCFICNALIYGGETGNKLYERFQNLLKSIRRKDSQPIPFTSIKMDIK